MAHKLRKCIDCGIIISDKRYNTYRGNRAIRCEECQDEYRRDYQKEYWQKNKDRYRNRWIGRLGNPDDDERFLEYKHGLDNIEEAEDRKAYINQYKPLQESAFQVNNQAEYPSYDKKRRGDEKWGEEYSDQDNW